MPPMITWLRLVTASALPKFSLSRPLACARQGITVTLGASCFP